MIRKINYLWRLLATGFCFAVFGIGGLFMGCVIFPVIFILPGGQRTETKRARAVIRAGFRLFFGMMHFLGVLRYKVIGRELIKNDRDCLVIANHPTLIDVISLISLYPNACCIVKKELWNNFFLKRVVSSAGYIPNDDPEALLQRCSDHMTDGDVLVIFPEGTRTVPGEDLKMKRGAAHIALRLNRPVRTIRIECNPMTLTKNQPWYRIPARRVDFTVTIKEMLLPEEYPAADVPLSLSSRRLTRKMLENITDT